MSLSIAQQIRRAPGENGSRIDRYRFNSDLPTSDINHLHIVSIGVTLRVFVEYRPMTRDAPSMEDSHATVKRLFGTEESSPFSTVRPPVWYPATGPEV